VHWYYGIFEYKYIIPVKTFVAIIFAREKEKEHSEVSAPGVVGLCLICLNGIIR
jgi:hypothetical protein